MARKTKKFESNADGPITVSLGQGHGIVRFMPGEVRTYETDDPVEIEALAANSDVSEVKQTKSKK
jgi:hypothetical protein